VSWAAAALGIAFIVAVFLKARHNDRNPRGDENAPVR
jgi:hypothetical protein